MASLDKVFALREEVTSRNLNHSSKDPEVTISEIPASPSDSTHSSSSEQIFLSDPASITQEFDALRFEAAAFGQLSFITCTGTSTPSTPEDTTALNNDITTYSNPSDYLISSPYNNPGHYLHLPTLAPASHLFALALTALQPSTHSYATAPYTSALNFNTVLSLLRRLCLASNFPWHSTTFYVVVFRSQLKPNIDNDWLYKLDYESHREACESGGLLKYWFGKADDERRNLATCFWHSREDAYRGGQGPWHKKARAAGRTLYESIVFSTYAFTVEDGAVGYRVEE